jgi:hypothetical protein
MAGAHFRERIVDRVSENVLALGKFIAELFHNVAVLRKLRIDLSAKRIEDSPDGIGFGRTDVRVKLLGGGDALREGAGAI